MVGLKPPPSLMMTDEQTSALILDIPKFAEKNPLRKLSPREREVCQWIYEGKRDREIGIILGISYRTVTVHVCSILAKLEVKNRTSAAMVWAQTIS